MSTVLMVVLSATGCWYECSDCDDDLDCRSIALREATGAPDECDVAACGACADSCDEGCSIMESYPPRYSCPGDGSWDVYDTCPDWEPPTPVPHATDIVNLGCDGEGSESLSAVATGPGQIAVMHEDAVLGCCPESIDVDVVASGDVLDITYDLFHDLCECACLLDVSYDLVDVPEGAWTIEAGDSGITATVIVP